ncbi:MAG: penicillin-binding protein 1A [Desulfotomaculaceae bacterium]|nr:penicillin-binding protein 1A [Desulfotomaculaceae bacterium]
MSQNKRRAKRKLNLLRLLILFIALIVVTGGVVSIGLFFTSVRDMPALTPGTLESGASSMIYDKDGNLISQIGIKNSVPVDLEYVPEQVKNAFLSIEDPGFYNHHGISMRGIARAAVSNIMSRSKSEGGSTITQQLVRTTMLSSEKTMERKIQEAVLAIQAERRYTKNEILEMYLNSIYLGEGAYGIQAASMVYFGKTVDELNLEEAALLGGLPQAPSAYSPFRDPEAAKYRRNDVLDSMVKNKCISAGEAEQAKATDIVLDDSEIAFLQYPYPYFLDYVTDQLVEKYGEDEVFKGGLRVYTTLDPDIQLIAEAAMARNDNFPASNPDENGMLQPEGATVVLEPNTGYIKALVGGREHTQRRQWNRAVNTIRQPGSAFKPIAVYGPAIEYLGLSPASVVDDAPVSYGTYKPQNFDGRYRGLITLRTAVADSVNVAAVKVMMDYVGIDRAIEFSSRLGIDLDPASHGASMALGGLDKGVTPLQMASAYGAFANSGIFVEPTAILKVEKSDGIILEQSIPRQQQVMKTTTAYLITDMLESAVQRGTGTGARIGRPVAGKTGTTDEGKDLWFVGYTPELVTAVWIGYDQPTPMEQAFGGTYPTRVWQEIMSKALRGVPSKNFAPADGIVTSTVDSKSGKLPGPNTPGNSLVTDLFIEGTVPTDTDNVHNYVEICPASGQLATSHCPNRVITTAVKLPYDVSDAVEDYSQRIPTEYCTMHGSGQSPSHNDDPKDNDDNSEDPPDNPGFIPAPGR